jgi:hypothetical protein
MTTCLNFLNVGESLAKSPRRSTPKILGIVIWTRNPTFHGTYKAPKFALYEKFESSCRNGTRGMSRRRDGLAAENFGSYLQRGFSSVTLLRLPPIFEALLNTEDVSKVILEIDGFLQSTGRPRLLLLGASHYLP